MNEPRQRDERWQRVVAACHGPSADLALAEVQRFLADFPDDAPAHATWSKLLSGQGRYSAAIAAAERSVALDPEYDFAHNALAYALLGQGDLFRARRAVAEAVAMDPDDLDHRVLQAEILLTSRRWKDGLAAADAALALQPEHVGAANLRSLALECLGRPWQAGKVREAVLARDAENAWAIERQAFASLDRGDVTGALERFRDALRLAPDSPSARAGLVEALRARNPVYRFVAACQRLVGRWKHAHLWVCGFLVLVYFPAVLRPGGGLTAAWILGGWVGLVLISATTRPFFDLLLLLHPLGRHALLPRDRARALLLACLLLAAAAFAVFVLGSG